MIFTIVDRIMPQILEWTQQFDQSSYQVIKSFIIIT